MLCCLRVMRSIAWNVLVGGSLLHILTSNTDAPGSHSLPPASRAEAVCHKRCPNTYQTAPLHFAPKYANAPAISPLIAYHNFSKAH